MTILNKEESMPSKKLDSQDGNSCAAHCTVVAIKEIKGIDTLNKDFAENDLWPSIQFKAQAGNPLSKDLASKKNSDPRLIVAQVKKRWSSVNVALVCDKLQKKTALTYIPDGVDLMMDAMFNMMSGDGVSTKVKLDEFAFYNCSYTMHNGSVPSKKNFDGLHNILVTYQGGKVYYYNSNEDTPVWSTVQDWKKLESQNGGNHSYVFTGVCVVIS